MGGGSFSPPPQRGIGLIIEFKTGLENNFKSFMKILKKNFVTCCIVYIFLHCMKFGLVINTYQCVEGDFFYLTLFHVASDPTYSTFGEEVSSPPSNFVIFKDKDLKFCDNVHF